MSVLMVAMVAPWITSGVLAATAGILRRRLPPPSAVRLVVAASLISALACGFVLAVAAFTLAAQNPLLAHAGGWTPKGIRVLDPVPAPVGIAAGASVLWLFATAVRRAGRTGRALWVAGMTCRRLGDGTGGMIVLDDEAPEAYALPGWSGRIVVSTGMLRALDPAERRVLLAHEASHLAHRHYLYLLLADVAAAANPLLRPATDAVRHGVERWADEDAATVVNDRRLAARAVARAALAKGGDSRTRHRPSTVLQATGALVVTRTRALLGPAPRPRRLLAAAVAALMLATMASVVVVDHATEQRFERAQTIAGHR